MGCGVLPFLEFYGVRGFVIERVIIKNVVAVAFIMAHGVVHGIFNGYSILNCIYDFPSSGGMFLQPLLQVHVPTTKSAFFERAHSRLY